MIDRDLWAQIEEDYKQARFCLLCPKGAGNWHRDEDTGMYRLYCAYQAARTSREKDHLLYARILSLMEWEHRHLSEYTRLRKFIAPAFEEYKLAVQNGGRQPYEKELQSIQEKFSRLTYICERTDNCDEELERAYRVIEDSELLADFEFHDSKPIFFQHTEQAAILKLDYGGIVATLEFTELHKVDVKMDPRDDWIYDMYCYRSYWDKNYIIFDTGYYRIACGHVKVLSVEKQGGKTPAAAMEELFDICDENGQPTGETVARSAAHRDGIMHRTAHIWIVREYEGRKQILLQKRSRIKDSFPGCLDTSSAGHIQAGDEPLDSARRELAEELGIHAERKDLKFIGTFRISFEKEFHGRMFRDEEVAFVHVYEKPVAIESLQLQKEELESVCWQDYEAVLAAVKRQDPGYCVPLGGLEMIGRYLGM